MAADQKRLLTNPKGKLSKVDIADVLRQDEAWALLPHETRQALYAMLPPPPEGAPAYDIDVHPLNNMTLEPHIKKEAERWQQDLREGREAKTWREQAMAAGKDRADGKWDEWKRQQRELDWGKPHEIVKPKEEVNGVQNSQDGNDVAAVGDVKTSTEGTET